MEVKKTTITLTAAQIDLIGRALRDMAGDNGEPWPEAFPHPDRPLEYLVRIFDGPRHREMALSLAPKIIQSMGKAWNKGKDQMQLSLRQDEISVITLALTFYPEPPELERDARLTLYQMQPLLLAP